MQPRVEPAVTSPFESTVVSAQAPAADDAETAPAPPVPERPQPADRRPAKEAKAAPDGTRSEPAAPDEGDAPARPMDEPAFAEEQPIPLSRFGRSRSERPRESFRSESLAPPPSRFRFGLVHGVLVIAALGVGYFVGRGATSDEVDATSPSSPTSEPTAFADNTPSPPRPDPAASEAPAPVNRNAAVDPEPATTTAPQPEEPASAPVRSAPKGLWPSPGGDDREAAPQPTPEPPPPPAPAPKPAVPKPTPKGPDKGFVPEDI